MIGNAWEWCEGNDKNNKMLLGGCWNMEIEKMGRNLQQNIKPLEYNNTIGFRCIKER